jgi:outer membrane protein OmpA-like peptidoglycan-associated protein
MSFLKTLLIGQLFVALIMPEMLWAITPCEEASDYVIEAHYLDSTERPLQKQWLQQALALCPDHPEAHHNLAVIFAQQNKDSDALYHYQQALKKSPNSSPTWAGIGDIYYKNSQWPLSLEAYLHACIVDSKARRRVAELLHENRYRIADGNVVLNHNSLALLYDPKRLQRLYDKAMQCRNRDRSIAPNLDTVRAISQPIAVFQRILFQVGKHDLSLVSSEQLDQIAITLRQMNAKNIRIRGHSDAQPFQGQTQADSDRLNWQLSVKRADTVKHALVQRGLAETDIKTMGYGNSRPLVSGNHETAWAKNRRVEIEISY